MKPLANPKEPLAKRLGIKEGHTVILRNVPESIITTLGAEVRQVHLQQTPGKNADMLICFVTNQEALQKECENLKAQIATHGALWIIWPKLIAGITTDLKEKIVQDIIQKHKLRAVNRCEIEYQYAGLKCVYRLQDRVF